jgi:hypothetical protein
MTKENGMQSQGPSSDQNNWKQKSRLNQREDNYQHKQQFGNPENILRMLDLL